MHMWRIKHFLTYLHYEYVIILLMGGNDAYATVRAQILLMDPIPPIAKVFSLIVQEQHQRAASEVISQVDMATNHSKINSNSSQI